MPIPIASRLVDFNAPVQAEVLPPVETETPADVIVEPVAGTDEGEVVDPYREGFQVGQAEAATKWAAERDALQADFARQLEEQRAEWVTQQAEALRKQLDAGFENLPKQVCRWFAGKAEPVMSEIVRQTALVALEMHLGKLRRRAVEVTFSGPQDLLGALEAVVQADDGAIKFCPDASCDVRIEADQTVIESCIGDWLESWRGTPE